MTGWIVERLDDLMRLLDHRAVQAWRSAREADDKATAAWHVGRAAALDEAASLLLVLSKKVKRHE